MKQAWAEYKQRRILVRKIKNTIKNKGGNMSNFTDFGWGAAQQAVGGAMGIAFGGAANKQQFKQQKKLTRLQIDAQKQLTDYNQMKQMEMWNATNYKAQREQMEKAGLNPALLYGMGGSGGATTGITAGSVGGGAAANHAGTMAGMGISAAQAALLRAQKENIEADTANKKADTANKPIQGQNIQAGTESILQGIKESKAKTGLIEATKGLEELALRVGQHNEENLKDEVYYRTATAMHNLSKITRENEIGDATVESQKDYIIKQAVGAGLANQKAGAEKDKIEAEMNQLAQKLKNETDSVAIQQQLADFETKFGKQFGGILSTILQAIKGRR